MTLAFRTIEQRCQPFCWILSTEHHISAIDRSEFILNSKRIAI